MAAWIYLTCALGSIACAGLLIRSYWRSPSKLLLWTAVCFACLAGNNVLLYVDLVVTGPEIDLSALRQLASLLGASALVYGLIEEVV